jgi:hypothetical protein
VGILGKVEPAMGFEPATACLQNRCSTIELRRPVNRRLQGLGLGKNAGSLMVAPRGLEPRTY